MIDRWVRFKVTKSAIWRLLYLPKGTHTLNMKAILNVTLVVCYTQGRASWQKQMPIYMAKSVIDVIIP